METPSQYTLIPNLQGWICYYSQHTKPTNLRHRVDGPATLTRYYYTYYIHSNDMGLKYTFFIDDRAICSIIIVLDDNGKTDVVDMVCYLSNLSL
jgi:hypothetical protein